MSSLRILMYSNDKRGGGHTSRTITIATSLSQTMGECSVLVLTDLATIGRFKFSERTDYVHLPGLKPMNGRGHLLHGLHIDAGSILKIRRKIIQSTLRTYQPDLVILDDSLLDLPGEMQKVVSCLVEGPVKPRIIWSWSDTLGEPSYVIPYFRKNEVLPVLERCADRILVLGSQKVFDVARCYELPQAIARKIVYTGYLALPPWPQHHERPSPAKSRLPLVMLVPGGGRNDHVLLDCYLQSLERHAAALQIQSYVVAGPAIRSHEKQAYARRAQKLPGVIFHRFGKHMLHDLRHADLVICSGGYEVMCEVLAHRKSALVIAGAAEPPDNFCRGRMLQMRGLITMMPQEECTPEALAQMIASLLASDSLVASKSQYEEISLAGLAKMTASVQGLLNVAAPDRFQHLET